MKPLSALAAGLLVVLLLEGKSSHQFSVLNKYHTAAMGSHTINVIQKDTTKCQGSLGPEHPCVSTANSCYCFVSQQQSWIAAYDFCRIHGMGMLSIQTLAKQQEIQTVLPKLTAGNQLVDKIGIWTSGTFARAMNSFIWSGYMTLFSFANWVYGAPYVSSSDCVRVIPSKAYQWADLDCGQWLPSVCESDFGTSQEPRGSDVATGEAAVALARPEDSEHYVEIEIVNPPPAVHPPIVQVITTPV